MSTGAKIQQIGNALMVGVAVLCAGNWSGANASQAQTQVQPQTQTQPQTAKPTVHRAHAARKKVPPPPPAPLPYGPTGAVPQVPLDSIPAVAPQVSFENNQLTIVAPNSTLADILKAVRKQTGAEIEVPAAPDRVVTHLGPGPARAVIADLLNGSRFNYVLLGAPQDDSRLTRVVLVPKSGNEAAIAGAAAPANGPQGVPQANQPPQPDPNAEAQEAEAPPDDNPPPDETAEQPADAEQQPPTDQPQVKTPQQMLQEMQQRQMQLQQQQNGAVPNPNTGMPPHPPQEQ